MRLRVVALIALAILLAGAAFLRERGGPHAQSVEAPGGLGGPGPIAPGPTALEEGLPSIDRAAPAAKPSRIHSAEPQKPPSRLPTSVPPRRLLAPQPRALPEHPSAGGVPPSGPSPAVAPLGGHEPSDERASPPGPSADATAYSDPQSLGEGSPDGRPIPAPEVLTPPALLTVPADAPPEAARVILDRTLLSPQLRVAALEGRVILAVLVRADGTVAQVRVEATSGSEQLDAAAVKAAQAWSFRPATRDGIPTESWAIIPVRFVVP